MRVFAVGSSCEGKWVTVAVFSTEDKAVMFIRGTKEPHEYAVSPVEIDIQFPYEALDSDYMWYAGAGQTKEEAIALIQRARKQYPHLVGQNRTH